MYEIRVTYFYYAGMLHAPEDGYLVDRCGGERLEFNTFNDALDYLKFDLGGVKCIKGKSTFISDAPFYYLKHGEYAQPWYTIRKIRGT